VQVQRALPDAARAGVNVSHIESGRRLLGLGVRRYEDGQN
jgi:hypothetical protein